MISNVSAPLAATTSAGVHGHWVSTVEIPRHSSAGAVPAGSQRRQDTSRHGRFKVKQVLGVSVRVKPPVILDHVPPIL
eukprot:6182094-Pleurochrysis_carterae.AAC.1